MERRVIRSLVASSVLVYCLLAGAGTAAGPAGACSLQPSPVAYPHQVQMVLRSGRDVWGERLLAARAGPTYAGARAFLSPLLYAAAPGDRLVTESGVYYLAFTPPPTSPYEQRGFALHVADGSEIIARRVGGRHLTILVGRHGRERYGSCLARLASPRLADGYLPVLETAYVDADGVQYRQESFAGHFPGSRLLASFVRLSVDARRSSTGAVVRLLTAGARGPTTHRDLESHSPGLLLVSSGGGVESGGVRYDIPRGHVETVYAVWAKGDALLPRSAAGAAVYRLERRRVVADWARLVARRVRFIVPDARVMNAERSLLAQEVAMTWRYSVGNTYEELSFAEALDVAEVMAAYGDFDTAREILRFTLRRLPHRFSSWRAGQRLAAAADYFWLTRDRRYLRQETPELAAAVSRLAAEIDRPGSSGLADREAVSTDVGTKVYGLHTQTAAWQGLATMSEVWRVTGHPRLAARSEQLAARLGAALGRAVQHAERRLPDGSLFVPLALLQGVRPFQRVTASRSGSYWNLLLPYALASGFFPAHGRKATGMLRYLLNHGTRLLGLVRAGDYKLYEGAGYPASGTDQVYGLSLSRFLADNDQPDQLVLTLYGMLGAGMTPNTDIAGEGASVAPLAGRRARTMLLPPNSAANATFLETLRLMLVHETRAADGRPNGLELAFSTPRGWLRPGRAIRIVRAPTSFGPVSYTIRRLGDRVRVTLDVPEVPSLRLRLRLPAGLSVRQARSAATRLPVQRSTDTIDLSGRNGRRMVVTVALAASTRLPRQ